MLDITDAALEKATEFISKRPNTAGIRVGVKTTGCSGLAYVLEYVDNAALDFVAYYDIRGLPVFINKEDVVYFHGVTLDWQKKGLNEGFDFINPNEKGRCGCGESFRV